MDTRSNAQRNAAAARAMEAAVHELARAATQAVAFEAAIEELRAEAERIARRLKEYAENDW